MAAPEKEKPPVDSFEKSWWQSKKFFAFLLTQMGFFGVLTFMLFKQDTETIGDDVSFLALVLVCGFLATGYILGQAALDRYLRVARIITGKENASDKTEPTP